MAYFHKRLSYIASAPEARALACASVCASPSAGTGHYGRWSEQQCAIRLFAALGARGEQAGNASRPLRRVADFWPRIDGGRSAGRWFRLVPSRNGHAIKQRPVGSPEVSAS